MSINQIAGIGILKIALTMGCSGNYGKIKRKTESESKAIQQELLENWSDYDIWLHYHPRYKPPRLAVIIFDTKNDDKKILVGSNWSKITDQQMWTEILKENTTSDGELTIERHLSYYLAEENRVVQEIWRPENQLYGFVIYQEALVSLG